ncbi:ribonuclease BN (tRNA processing enzyme) [Nakamurella sp. UYEF19]|uniref:MBL fold metallo-hydrolase n=1 Tax=Nakamurella sp. UYEF19 TaxID=1756392 RepID=UPI003395CC55
MDPTPTMHSEASVADEESVDGTSEIVAQQKKSHRHLSRRGLLTAAGGTAVGAVAVGAVWYATRAPTPPAQVARLMPSNGIVQASTWTTLGTMGGPIASAHRSQPANLLMHNGSDAILIDSGDGAVDQIQKAGIDLAKVGTVILSHLHLDHTAGLYGVIGRRLQQHIPGELRIYGPPGTGQVVKEITASQQYVADLLNTDSAAKNLTPTTVKVTEITDGAVFTAGAAKVSATTNSHYGFKDGTADAARFQSLSYRFDLPGRSIVYTGDTGPSANVDRLAAGADLLVSEIIDADQALADLRASRADIPALASHALLNHFAEQHLTAQAVGDLARRAGVKAVVLTHNPMNDTSLQKAGVTLAGLYQGPVAFAADLDTY